MTSEGKEPFRVDRRLKVNIFFAILLIVLCPLALWQFYFRHDRTTAGPRDPSRLVNNYCRAYNKPIFHSAEVMAPQVDNYLGRTNVTPVDIDHDAAIERQTLMYPHLSVINGSVHDTLTMDGRHLITAWLQEVCYVKSMMQYRSRELHYAFTVNGQDQFTAADTIGSRNSAFTRTIPK